MAECPRGAAVAGAAVGDAMGSPEGRLRVPGPVRPRGGTPSPGERDRLRAPPSRANTAVRRRAVAGGEGGVGGGAVDRRPGIGLAQWKPVC